MKKEEQKRRKAVKGNIMLYTKIIIFISVLCIIFLLLLAFKRKEFMGEYIKGNI